MNDRPIYGPPQSDQEAANSARPDTETLPRWDDEGWDEYLYAVDRHYRFDYLVAHGQITTDEEARAYWDEYDDEDGEDE